MTSLTIEVVGSPAPQGSKSAFRNKHTGRIQMVESSKKVKPWRQDVRQAALDAIGRTGFTRIDDGPVAVAITFHFLRPASHYGTGRNRHQVKDSAPAAPCNRATYDIDKLTRSTLDALTGVVLGDDAQVADLAAIKAWCESDTYPGASIYVTPLTGYVRRVEDAPVQGALL